MLKNWDQIFDEGDRGPILFINGNFASVITIEEIIYNIPAF